jgi:hypothetical protein
MVRKQQPGQGQPQKKSKRKAVASAAGGDGFDSSAQDSEYLNLLKRVDARKDAKQILKIAKRIQEESD